MQHKKILLILAILIISIGFIGRELATAKKPIPGVITYQFVWRCKIWSLDTSLQPTHTVALACPGVDLIRLWPLPIQHPWFEDSAEPPVDDLQRSLDIPSPYKAVYYPQVRF